MGVVLIAGLILAGGARGALAATPAVANFGASPVPVLTGVASVGSTLTAKPGTWLPAPVTLTYQWERAGAVIPGANNPKYTLVAADSGKQLEVSVTGSKAGYASVTRTSAPTKAVPAIVSGVPTITGSAVVGKMLTANPGTWSPAGVALSYRWSKNGVALGSTTKTYMLKASDVGAAFAVTVSAVKTGYAPVSATSVSTGVVVAANTVVGPVPTVTGAASDGVVVGSRLSASPGVWSPTPVSLTYQWLRNGVPIPGAASSVYTSQTLDAGTSVSVRVTGSKPGYQAASQTSQGVHVRSANPGYDIVVILGQSNAQGAGLPFDPVLDAPVPGLDQLAGSGPSAGTIIPAVDSLFEVTQWRTETGEARVGPGMELGRQLLAHETGGRQVLLVPAAQGSTTMTGDATYSWDPSNTTAQTNLYNRALTQIDKALAENPNNRLAGIIWAQGEGDAALTTGSVYGAKLLTIIDGLRARYGAVPFLVGGMVPEWVAAHPDAVPIQQALESMATARPDVAYVAGVSGHNQDDLIHYDAAGARMMGAAYYRMLASLRATAP